MGLLLAAGLVCRDLDLNMHSTAEHQVRTLPQAQCWASAVPQGARPTWPLASRGLQPCSPDALPSVDGGI